MADNINISSTLPHARPSPGTATTATPPIGAHIVAANPTHRFQATRQPSYHEGLQATILETFHAVRTLNYPSPKPDDNIATKQWAKQIVHFNEAAFILCKRLCNEIPSGPSVLSTDGSFYDTLRDVGILVCNALQLPTERGTAIPTRFYMGEEQTRTLEEVDEEVDSYWDKLADLQKSLEMLKSPKDENASMTLYRAALDYVEKQMIVVEKVLTAWDVEVRNAKVDRVCHFQSLETANVASPVKTEKVPSSVQDFVAPPARDSTVKAEASPEYQTQAEDDSSDDDNAVYTPESSSDDEMPKPMTQSQVQVWEAQCKEFDRQTKLLEAQNRKTLLSARQEEKKELPHAGVPVKSRADHEQITTRPRRPETFAEQYKEYVTIPSTQSVNRPAHTSAPPPSKLIQNHDYYAQLHLLEQQNKARLMAVRRQEQEDLARAQKVSNRQVETFPKEDYFAQLRMLEEQNKRRLMAARQQQNVISPTHPKVNLPNTSTNITTTHTPEQVAAYQTQLRNLEDQNKRRLELEARQMEQRMSVLNKDTRTNHTPEQLTAYQTQLRDLEARQKQQRIRILNGMAPVPQCQQPQNSLSVSQKLDEAQANANFMSARVAEAKRLVQEGQRLAQAQQKLAREKQRLLVADAELAREKAELAQRRVDFSQGRSPTVQDQSLMHGWKQLDDYLLQLTLADQQNKKRMMMAQQQHNATASVQIQSHVPSHPNLTSDDFRKRLADRVAAISADKTVAEGSAQSASPASHASQASTLSQNQQLPIRGIRGGYMSPSNSDNELPKAGNNEEESDEDSSSSEEEYEGDDLDAAGVTQQKLPTDVATKTATAVNNPLLTAEPLVFQQRSKYFQRHQEIREATAQKGGSHVPDFDESALPSIPTGGLFGGGGGALFESEKAATSTDSLGSTKRKRDDDEGNGDKGKQKEVEDEAPLHDDIDDYERELRELEDRNRKRAMTAKSN